jgi:ROS/MUCR transcriptional regulator protein
MPRSSCRRLRRRNTSPCSLGSHPGRENAIDAGARDPELFGNVGRAEASRLQRGDLGGLDRRRAPLVDAARLRLLDSLELALAVSIRKSVSPDYLICLDDGLKFKSLRRHLSTLGMTPDQYRAKWNLPGDYPMVASNYAARRSELAKKIGFGHLRKKAVPATPSLPPASVSKRKAARPRT